MKRDHKSLPIKLQQSEQQKQDFQHGYQEIKPFMQSTQTSLANKESHYSPQIPYTVLSNNKSTLSQHYLPVPPKLDYEENSKKRVGLINELAVKHFQPHSEKYLGSRIPVQRSSFLEATLVSNPMHVHIPKVIAEPNNLLMKLKKAVDHRTEWNPDFSRPNSARY